MKFIRLRICLVMMSCFLLAALAGCGGGSTGTGLGNAIDGDGVITFLDGSPAAGLVVHAETSLSDDTEVSDASGRYSLDLLLEPGTSIFFTFDSEALDLHWEREITGIPAAARRLTVSWQVTEDKRVSPVATEFFDAGGNRLE